MIFAVGCKCTFYLLTYLFTTIYCCYYYYYYYHYHQSTTATTTKTVLLLLLCYHAVIQAHMGGTPPIWGENSPKVPLPQVGNLSPNFGNPFPKKFWPSL